ncbi:MAG: hypothetical protein GPJ54_02220 [Candidatus Heimdallarchaeota archaeon]|nr:hypothetical protein [Candidatus Heimdallarchaeota archaeon]
MQKEDDAYLSLTLPVALFGLLNALFYVIISITAWFGHELIIRVQQEPTDLNLVLENLLLLIPITIIASVSLLFLFYLFSETFSQYNFITEFNDQVKILAETLELDSEDSAKSLRTSRYLLLKELSFVYVYGLLAGLFYTIIYAIPFIFLYIFFIFVIINFSAFTATVTTSMLLSWFLLSIYIVRQKLIVEEINVRNLDPQADYGYTDRTVEILASNEPPIICPGCRSYIVATSKICIICGEKI